MFAAYFLNFLEPEKSYCSHNTDIAVEMCSFIQIFLLNAHIIVIYSLGSHEHKYHRIYL